MSLTVKAFLEIEGKSDPEIRRFPLPQDVSSSYDYLVKKIAAVFPALREGHFSTSWKDPDGDLVVFSADEELMEALCFQTDSIFKIYLKTTDALVSNSTNPVVSPQNSVGKVHPGVVCDGCNGHIKGIRYKCMECEDYDLCSTCELKGLHAEHNLMKIVRPNRAPFYVPPHRGGAGASPRCGFGRGHGEFAPPPHFRRWMRRFMRRWHNQNTSGCPMEPDSPDDELSPPEDFCGWSTGALGKHGKRSRGPCKERKCSPQELNKETFRQAARQPGDMMTRKIEMNIVKDLTKEETAREVMQQGEGSSVDTEEITHATEKIVLDDPKNVVDGMAVEQDQVQPTVVKEFAEGRQPPEVLKMDVQHGNRYHPQNVTDVDNWTLMDNIFSNSMSQDTTDTVAAPTPTQAPPTQGPPVSAGSGVPPGQGAARSVQIQMPPQIVYPPSSPQVAQALQQMLAMGFNNDNGWLTRLLESKNGDIIQVLDAIKPQPSGRARQTSGGYMA